MKSNVDFQRLQETNTGNGTSSGSNVNFTTTGSTSATPIVVTATGDIISNQPNAVTRNNTGNYTGSYTVITPSPTLYRTKCDPNTIPLVARDMTWTDPFYEYINYDNNDAIIAVFDMERTVYDFNAVTMLLYFSILFFGAFFYGFFFLVLIFIFLIFNDQLSNMSRLQRTHIAITHNGIYIDEVDVPGSTKLRCRTFIAFSDIPKCNCINEYGWIKGSKTRKIHLTMQHARTGRSISGIKQQQKFVDIVNAMIVNTPPLSTETIPVPLATMEEQSNVEALSTTTSIQVASNKDIIADAKIV